MKKKNMVLITICTFILMAVVFGATILAQSENQPVQSTGKLPNSWYQRNDAEKTKTISIVDVTPQNNNFSNARLISNSENGSKKITLTYLATDGSKTGYPIDIYEDEQKNQFRYNPDGEIDAYRHGNNETANIRFGDLTKEQAANQTQQFITQLYGERIEGFELLRCVERSSNQGYFVDYGKTYGVDGFIVGAKSCNAIQLNGEFSYCTISDDLLTDFDPAVVENLTKEQVLKKVASEYVLSNPDVEISSINISSSRLIRQDNGFALQIVITYENSDENITLKDVCYYTIEG